MQKQGFFDALHDVFSWAYRAEVLDHLFAKLLFVKHIMLNYEQK